MTDESIRHRLSEIVVEWNEAERAIKLAELSADNVVLPAIVELRYAGRRLVEFLSLYLSGDADTQRSASLLSDTLHNVARAKQDAIDAMVAKVGSEISNAIETYGPEAFPDVLDDIDTLKTIKSKIANTREIGSDRSKIYNEIAKEDLEEIFSMSQKYSYLFPRAGRSAKLKRALSFPTKASAIIVAAGGGVSAILGLLVALLGT
jgi:hypothetical protein